MEQNTVNPLATLRNLFNPPDDVNFELHLNKHPKNHKNKSLSYALNMKISDDGSVIQNDESIRINDIGRILYQHYNANYKIIHIIPCNTELVLFVSNTSNVTQIIDIWRYRENDKTLALFYNKRITYYNGKFSSTFTYTSNDSLIIAFCEYDSEVERLNPIMTINLGTFKKGHIYNGSDILLQNVWISEENEFNDRNLDVYKLPLCPEVSLPKVESIKYSNNLSYQGHYIPYIRYKINEYDYTQWYSFGFPIVNNIVEPTTLYSKTTVNQEGYDDVGVECYNAHATTRPYTLIGYFSKETDTIYNSIILSVSHSMKYYESFQLGFVCIAKTYTKYFISKDIDFDYNIDFEVSLNNLIEEQFNINKYENYYNVKNIINKKNKLYISNYETFNDNVDYQSIANNINLKLITGIPINVNDYINNSHTEFNYTFNNIQIALSDLLYTNRWTYGYATRNGQLTYPTVTFPLFNLALILKYLNKENFIIPITGHEFKVSTGYLDGNNQYVEVISENHPIDDLYVGTTSDVNVSQGDFDTYFHLSNDRERAEYLEDKRVLNNCIGYVNKDTNTLSDFVAVYRHDSLDVSAYGYDYTILPYTTKRIVRIYNGNNDYLDLDDLGDLNVGTPMNVIMQSHSYQTIQSKINNYIPSSLVQGEVYDFYIHFVDKYGNNTKGYKLTNNFVTWKRGYITGNVAIGFQKHVISNSDIVFINIRYRSTDDVLTETTYAIENTKLFDGNTLKTFSSNSSDNNIHMYTVPVGRASSFAPERFAADEHVSYSGELVTNATLLQKMNNAISDLQYLEDKDIEIKDIFDYYPYDNNYELGFYPYYNSRGDLLFKVPVFNNLNNRDDELDCNLGLLVENITIPSGFVNYFISAKKHENLYTLDGSGNKDILFNDYINMIKEGKIGGNIIKTHYFEKTTEDYSASFILNKNMLRNRFSDIHAIENINLSYAGESQKNRIEKGSCIYITNVLKDINLENVQYIEIMNFNRHLYEYDSELYRISDYMTQNDTRIYDGFNGRFTRSSCFKFGTSLKGVSACTTNRGTGSFGDVMYFSIFGYYAINQESIYLTKSAHNYITSEIYYQYIDTLGLYDTKLLPFENINIENQYIFKNNYYLNKFNRTVYRSNVISDETRQNNWRFFETDAYKNIEENKGNITNLVAIGNYLYVHTEHSLFAFNDDNTLNTNNQNIQLGSVDVFDTEYKEQFRTTLGYGGLQDKEAWCAGEFGYIYYNNDNKELIKLYGNELDIISKDIKEWIYNLNPDAVRFCQDIKNNRIFIQFRKNANKYILSYNYKYKVFVSVHDYVYNLGYNTKNNLYMLTANDRFVSEYKENDYGWNENSIIYNPNETILKNGKLYKLNFIINYSYNSVKYLENIIYKLRKFNITADKNIDYTEFPIEMNIIQYSGNWLRVHNDLIDTGEMDINNLMPNNKPSNDVYDYTKPYWELGNWNFNNLRDIHNKIYSTHDDMSRLYGNYFIIAFTFGNSQEVPITELLEFENLQVKLTEDKNI